MYARVLVLIFFFAVVGGILVHAPYQAGLFLFQSYNANFGTKNFAICSAAIIHPLFYVTTASCIISSNITPYQPSSIYIKSGNFSEAREHIKYVRAIHIHKEFDFETMKHDIALLQMQSLYQFEHPHNEQWIQIGDMFTRYDHCLSSISSPNVAQSYPFGPLKETTIVNNNFCQKINRNHTSAINGGKLCSFYDFDHSFMCQVPDSQLKHNRDRGTPLICNSKLVGLLSVIISPNRLNSTTDCIRTLRTYALYVNVPSYEKWIHSVIAVNSPTHGSDGKAIPLIPIVPPYQNPNVMGYSIRNNASVISSSCVMIIIISITCFLSNLYMQ